MDGDKMVTGQSIRAGHLSGQSCEESVKSLYPDNLET